MPPGHDITIINDRFLKNPSKIQFWAAQVFGFRGDKYLTKKVRVVSLIQGMLTGPYLYLNIIKIFQTI